MNELTIYLKVFGLAEDKNGNKDYAGVKVTLGEVDEEVTYERLTESISKEALLHLIHLQGVCKPDDIVIITPEEYERDYGEESEDSK